MANASLNTRLESLERVSNSSTPMLVVGPYAEGSDSAAEQARELVAWEARNGRPVSANTHILHIVLRGIKPGEVRDDR